MGVASGKGLELSLERVTPQRLCALAHNGSDCKAISGSESQLYREEYQEGRS